MSTNGTNIEIKKGEYQYFEFQEDGDPDELGLARIVERFHDEWVTNRYSEGGLESEFGADVDLAMHAYDELIDVSPHLALSMVAWFLSEHAAKMHNEQRQSNKKAIVKLIDIREDRSVFLENKPNVDIIYQRSQLVAK